MIYCCQSATCSAPEAMENNNGEMIREEYQKTRRIKRLYQLETVVGRTQSAGRFRRELS